MIIVFLSMSIRPHPHVWGYFLIRNFFFPETAFVHAYPVYPAEESATFLHTLSRVEIFESALNLYPETVISYC